MPVRRAVASGNFSSTATWNDGAILGIPTGSDDIWTNTFNVNIDQSFSANSLNNSVAVPRAHPAMTSNTTPSPFAANASNQVATAAWVSFDGNYIGSSGWLTGAVTSTGWISLDFGTGSVIDSYAIYGGGTATLNPNRWDFQGSNDTVTWVTLQAVTSSIGANSSYTSPSLGNTTPYRYYRVNVTANGGGTQVNIRQIFMYAQFQGFINSGGSFIFNSGSISGSATSTTAALTAGATNLIQVTAATGSVTLSLGSSVNAFNVTSANLILHSGNCDFNLNGQNFNGGSGAFSQCIGKSSAGTITIRGNLNGGGGGFAPDAFASNNGNTVIIGNIAAGTNGRGVVQTAGNVIVTGNIAGGAGGTVHGISLTGASSQFAIIGNVTGGGGTSAHGINHSGTSGSVIGNVTGGAGNSAHGIITVGAVTVTGTVTGGVGASATGVFTNGPITVTGNAIGGSGAFGVSSAANVTVIGGSTAGSTSAINIGSNNVTINQTGNVTSTSTAVGITSTGTGTVLLTGNMINVSGRQAIFAQNLFISNTATTQWRLFTPGGQDKTLYSADTFPNQPTPANVRSGSLFGPSNVLSGSMVVPSPSDVRVSVLTDNTVGTGQSLTAADFLAAISASADPYAERLRNVATVDTVGSLLTGFNNGGF